MTEKIRQRLQDSGFNLNTVILVISLIGATTTTVFFFAPLKTLPTDVKALKSDVEHVQKMQAVQAETLRILAEVSSDTKETRHEFDKHSSKTDSELLIIHKRLDRLEDR